MAHSLWQSIRLAKGSRPFRDVIEKCERRISRQMRGPLLGVAASSFWVVAFAATSETAMAFVVASSLSGPTGCAYDSLGPGGYFQGTDVPSPPAPMVVSCATVSAINQIPVPSLSYTVHPGLPGESGAPTSGRGIAIPNSLLSSAVGAFAENGGGGDATSIIYYALFNTQTDQIDPDAAVAMGLMVVFPLVPTRSGHGTMESTA